MSKFSTWLNSLTADASPDTAADYLVSYDASATTSKKVLMSVLLALASGSGIPTDGWIAAADTWTYASADGPTGVFTISGVDRSAVLTPGKRIKLTQTTTKYFIVTAVSFSTDTTVTIYGGTDYTLANAAITSPYYSPVKAPSGFNTDPSKWTVSVTDSTQRVQASPTQNTWYNVGTTGEQIIIPIGLWIVSYRAQVYVGKTNSYQSAHVTLSTANNSESDATMTGATYVVGGTNFSEYAAEVYRTRVLSLAAKTTYYLNEKTELSGAANVGLHNQYAALDLRAVCAYL